MQKNVKRIVSVLSAAAMCAAMIAEPFGSADIVKYSEAVVASADTVADTMVIYDETGKNISTGKDAYIYLDNSDVSGGRTSTTITVKVSKEAGEGDVDDKIYYIQEKLGKGNEKVEVTKISETSDSLTLQLASYVLDESTGKSKSLKPGTTYLEFSTKSGEVYRKLYIVVYQPGTDISTSFSKDKTKIAIDYEKACDIPKYYYYNSSYDNGYDKFIDKEDAVEKAKSDYANIYGPSDYLAKISAISNHQYQLNSSINGTDSVIWSVYDGEYHAGIENDGTPSYDMAEITQDGLFTPKKNGTVTLVAKAKPVLPYQSKETDSEEGASSGGSYENTAYSETFKRPETHIENKKSVVFIDEKTESTSTQNIEYVDKTIPKYIQVSIIKENPAKSLWFENAPAGLQLNETIQLDLKAETSTSVVDATGITDVIRWVSSNTKVATVDSKGQVTAVGKGEVTITAYGENENVSASCNLRVYSKASSISITPSPTSTRIGIPVTLTANISPDNAEDEIIWTSSDEDIATVVADQGQFGNLVQKAVVTGGTKSGTATIIATAKYSGVQATCQVIVNDKIESDSIELYYYDNGGVRHVISNNETVDMFRNTNMSIDALLTSKDGSTPDDEVKWEITQTDSFVSYEQGDTNKNMKFTARQLGTAQVTAYSAAHPEIKTNFTINVVRPANKITIVNETNRTNLRIGETAVLSADLQTSEASYVYDHADAVKSWTSSNESVAEVNSAGLVTIKSIGTATITCTTLSGLTKTINFTGYIPTNIVFKSGVTAAASADDLPTAKITLKKSGTELTGTATLTAAVTGYSTASGKEFTVSNPTILWSSDDETVATVDEKGKVTAVDVGQCVITAVCGSPYNPNQYVQALVTVSAPSSLFTVEFPECYYSPFAENYTPQPLVTAGSKELTEGVDYEIEYSSNTAVTTSAKATITGLGQYTGSVSKTFKILARPLSDPDVYISDIEDQQATGKAVTPEYEVSFMGVPLVKSTDFTEKFANNTNLSNETTKATLTITGKGNYGGTAARSFSIICQHPEESLKLTSTTVKPTCTENGRGTYTCQLCKATFTDSIIPATGHTLGTATVTKEATCTAAGTKTAVCKTCKQEVTETIPALGHNFSTAWTTDKAATCTAEGSKSHHCTRCNAKDPTSVTAIAKTAHKYTTKVVAPTYTAKGYTLHTCSVCGYSYKDNEKPMLTRTSLSTATVTLSATGYAYDGYAKKPTATVKVGSKTLTNGTDYSISYKNNTAVGTATVTITGKTAYTGTVTKTFSIVPANVTGMKPAATGQTAIKLSWTAVKGATGYVVYRYNPTTKSWIRLGVTKTNTYMATGLVGGTTYAFTARAYTTANGVNVYSKSFSNFFMTTNPAKPYFAVASPSSGRAYVKWNKVTGATGYVVYYRVAGGGWQRAGIVNAATTAFNKYGLKSGTTYAFAVRAYRTYGGKNYYGAFDQKGVKIK